METLLYILMVCACAFGGCYYGLRGFTSKYKLVEQTKAVAYDREKELLEVSLQEQAKSKLFGAAHSYYLIQQNCRTRQEQVKNKCCKAELQIIIDEIEKALEVKNDDQTRKTTDRDN
jgi:hypothetical protein